MFAVIFQSKVSDGFTQVAYVPHKGQTLGFIRHLSDSTNQRGISGAWNSLTILHVTGGEALGEPVAISVTPSDLRDLETLPKPSTLLQKLVRAVQSETAETGRYTGQVSKELLEAIESGDLSLYTKPFTAIRRATRPVSVLPDPEPVVVAPVVAEVAEPAMAYISLPDAPHQTSPEQLVRRMSPLRYPEVDPDHFPRELYGKPSTELFEGSRLNGMMPLLIGEAGTGKTSEVEYYAATKNLPFLRFECSFELTEDHTQGRLLPVPLANGTTTWEWHYSELATIIQQPGVVLLNELNRTPSRNAILFLGLLEERQLRIPMLNEVIEVHPECLIVADQNVGAAYGVQSQDAALLDRLRPKIEFEDDPAIEAKVIPSPSLLEFAEALRFVHKTDRAKMRTRVGLRMLTSFVKQSKLFGLNVAVNTLMSDFPVAERATVRMHFDTRYDAIASELGVDVSTYAPADTL